jgi:uncharacterized protein
MAHNFLEKSSSMERTNVDVFLAGIEKAFRHPSDIYIYVIHDCVGKSPGNQRPQKHSKATSR